MHKVLLIMSCEEDIIALLALGELSVLLLLLLLLLLR